jgi:cell wall-associated NlpC family hydrolase
LESESEVPETVKSTLPVRGRTVAIAALAAVLIGLLLAAVDARAADTPTGGFSSEAPTTPLATAAMNSDRRTALAPAAAPPEVAAAVAAANRITRKPYKWGGGHGRWRDRGYDCSGTVSYVLHAAGLLKHSRDSTGFMSYGERGKGDWITVYAHGSHAYMIIAGLRFDTSGRGEEGPRWRLERRSGRGYAKRHPAGL